MSKSAFGLLQSRPKLEISQNISLYSLNLKIPDGPISFVFFLKIICIMEIEIGKGKRDRKSLKTCVSNFYCDTLFHMSVDSTRQILDILP